MVGYLPIFNAMLPVFLVMLTGFLLRRIKLLTREADASLLRLVFNVLFPAFILKVILGSSALQQGPALAAAPVFAFGAVTGGFAVAYLVGRLLGLAPVERRTFGFTTGIFNYGFIPIFVVMQLFDDGGSTLGTLIVHNIGVDLAIWSAGLMLLTGSRGWSGLRRLVNGPLLAVVAGLALKLTGTGPMLPAAGKGLLDMLGACAVPLGVMLAGATLADSLESRGNRPAPRTAIAALLLRMLLLPAAMLVLAVALPLSTELKRVIVVQAAMPAGLFTIVIAKHYQGSVKTALAVIVPTTLVSLLTIPLVITLGLKWIGVGP